MQLEVGKNVIMHVIKDDEEDFSNYMNKPEESEDINEKQNNNE